MQSFSILTAKTVIGLHKCASGVTLVFQGGRSFVTILGFQGQVLVQILDFPIHSIHFHFSLSSRQGEVS